jgi:small subunit ribosomal protein S19e
MTLLTEKSRGPEGLITPNDVPASKLIERLAKHLKENVDAATPPAWASVVKTGAHVEKQPQNPDWWYIRCASLLRKIYIHGPIGIEKLRASYGGGKNPGVTPQHAAKAGGAIVRKALQALEAAGLAETVRPGGRRVTREGRKLLQEMAAEIGKELVKNVPELEKYQKGD